MKKLSLFAAALLLAGAAAAQAHKFEWANHTGNSGGDFAYSVATDKDGNVYSSGKFRNTVDFDPGPGTSNLTAVSTRFDLFISKFDKDGNFIWVNQLGGVADKGTSYLQTDTAGNVYITGYFSGKIDFDPGTGTFELAADTTQDIFVAKYTPNGELSWAKQMGYAYNYCIPTAIAVDTFGNVYTTGIFNDTVDFDPGPATFLLHSLGYGDSYISKLDKEGNFAWAKVFGAIDANIASAGIVADELGNTYTTGGFSNIIDFDPGAGVSVLSAKGNQTFVLKLDADGDFAWANQIEHDASDSKSSNGGVSAALDKSGDLYIAGNFSGAADFDPGVALQLLYADSVDAYVLKLSKDGDYIWAKQVGGKSVDNATCIRTDELENSYLSGTFYEGGDFDPGAGEYTLNSVGQRDMFLVKLDESGDFVWAKSIGGTGEDQIAMIALDQELSIYSTGNFIGAADFNPGAGVATLTSYGSSDIFLQKLSPCTPSVAPDTFTTNFCKSYTFGDVTYTKPGIYKQMLSNSDGCDSLVTLELTTEVIIDPDTFTTSFCASYTFGGVTYTKAGIYTQTLSNSKGCDSIVTLKLTNDPIIDMTVTKSGNTLQAA
ncbi:MAG TPA: SBBP repeat-containing protein, partial [Chitinophagaceae bacterium]|nr:SBBP repeat-containing protein [Chitinophagaceae bacterium]